MSEDLAECRAISEVDLAEVDTDVPIFNRDWPTILEDARRHHWLAHCKVGYFVLDYEAQKDLMSMDGRVRTPQRDITRLMGAESSPWGKFNDNFLLAMDLDDHSRVRSVVAKAFTPANANRMRSVMREEILRLLDEWNERSEFDFVDFISRFPISVMCRMIGARASEVPRIREALEMMAFGQAFNPALLPKLDSAVSTLSQFVQELVAERRAHRARTSSDQAESIASDLLDQILDASGEGNRLSEDELIHLLILLFSGGYDTSRRVSALLTYLTLDRPPMWRRLAEEEGFAAKAIDETLRHSSITTTFRYANEDILYRDVLISKDTLLIFPIKFAGRDKARFPDGGVFDPDRKYPDRHFAFGRGAHLCLGQFIARAQIEEAFQVIPQRWPDLRRNGDVDWMPFIGPWGLANLPVSRG